MSLIGDDLLKKVSAKTLTIIMIGFFLLLYAALLCFYFCAPLKSEELKNFLDVTVSWISICTFLFVSLQTIFFLKDFKLKNARQQKEYSLQLAKEYANEILPDISFVSAVIRSTLGAENCQTISTFEPKLFTSAECECLKTEILKIYKNYEKDVFSIDTIKHFLFLLSDKSRIKFESIEYIEQEKLKKEYNKAFNFLADTVLNRLECFAMALNQNVAEDLMLYPSLHQTMLRNIKIMAPRLADRNNSHEDKYYTNVIEIYHRWQKYKQENIDALNRENHKHQHSTPLN